MTKYRDFLVPSTNAAKPQTLATSLEAEANIKTAEVRGGVGESAPVFAGNNNVSVVVETIDTTVEDFTALLNDAAGIDAVVTSVTYDTGAGTKPSLPFVIKIGTEEMKVTADTGTVFTIVRGYNGTTAATHANNAAISVPVLASHIDTAVAAVGNLVRAKGEAQATI